MLSRKQNRALDMMRTIAAVLVVIGHARALILVPHSEADAGHLNTILYAATGLANGAVMVFFVLSGFLVGGKAIRGWISGNFAWARYLVDRTVRLWIVLLPALLLTFLADATGRTLFPESAKYGAGGEIAEHSSLTILAGNAFFLQSHLVPAFGSNGPLWSLAYEYGYYLLFPVILLGILGRRRRVMTRIAFAIATGALAVVFGPYVILFFSMWLLGALTAWASPHLLPLVRKLTPAWLSAARVVAGFLAFAGMALDSIFNGSPQHLTAGGVATAVSTAVLLVLLVDDWEPRSQAMRHVLSGISGYAHVSYSLYAAHVPVLLLIAVAIGDDNDTGSFTPDLVGWCLVFGVTLAMIVVGWIFGSLTERHTDRVRAVAYRLLRIKEAKPVRDHPQV